MTYGRHWESHLIDRYRFARMVKRAVNLPDGGRLERTSKIINLRQEVIPVVDTTLDSEPVRRTLNEIDLPVTAANVAGTVTVTARNAGTLGNDIDLRYAWLGSVGG